MKIVVDKNNTQKIIEDYYNEQIGIDGKVSIFPKISLSGYGMYEYEKCYLEISLKYKMKLLGKEYEALINIDKDDVSNAFKYAFSKENYNIKSFNYLNGLDYITEGYGMGEHTCKKPYFKGIEIELSEKTKKIGGIK